MTLADADANSVVNPSAYNGQVRWAGPPLLNVNDGVSGTFDASQLPCDPFLRDWSDLDLLHVYGSVIVPASDYDVTLCSTTVGQCSRSLRVATAKWGDIVAPYSVGQPNFQDIVSIVDKFQNRPSGPSKSRTKLREPVDPSAAIGFLEVSADVFAFQGKADKQLFPPPSTCP